MWLFFNSLENEPVSVSDQLTEFIQLWKQTGGLKSDVTFTAEFIFALSQN